MVDTFTPKRIEIDGKAFLYVPNTLVEKGGFGETNTRVQVSGRSVVVVPSENLETQFSEISFDIMMVDSDSDSDPIVLIEGWKSSNGTHIVNLIPDGAGQSRLYRNASLMNDPTFQHSSDGVISLTWNAAKVTRTNSN
jgi:hypothetical protein